MPSRKRSHIAPSSNNRRQGRQAHSDEIREQCGAPVMAALHGSRPDPWANHDSPAVELAWACSQRPDTWILPASAEAHIVEASFGHQEFTHQDIFYMSACLWSQPPWAPMTIIRSWQHLAHLLHTWQGNMPFPDQAGTRHTTWQLEKATGVAQFATQSGTMLDARCAIQEHTLGSMTSGQGRGKKIKNSCVQ